MFPAPKKYPESRLGDVVGEDLDDVDVVEVEDDDESGLTQCVMRSDIPPGCMSAHACRRHLRDLQCTLPHRRYIPRGV